MEKTGCSFMYFAPDYYVLLLFWTEREAYSYYIKCSSQLCHVRLLENPQLPPTGLPDIVCCRTLARRSSNSTQARGEGCIGGITINVAIAGTLALANGGGLA